MAASETTPETNATPRPQAVPTLAEIKARTKAALAEVTSITVDGTQTVTGLPKGVQPYVLPADANPETRKVKIKHLMEKGWTEWPGDIATALPARPTVFVMARDDYERARDERGRRLAEAQRGR